MLVGIGTDLSNGCTSGHGLCGMPRLSIRSFTAVMAFLSTAIATATFSLGKHIPDIKELDLPVIDKISVPSEVYLGIGGIVALIMIFRERSKPFLSKVLLFFIGTLFGFGLMMAGMSQRSKIYGFLQLNSHWDPSLLFVLMTGVLINALTFNLIIMYR